jgi:hypothetical protein
MKSIALSPSKFHVLKVTTGKFSLWVIYFKFFFPSGKTFLSFVSLLIFFHFLELKVYLIFNFLLFYPFLLFFIFALFHLFLVYYCLFLFGLLLPFSLPPFFPSSFIFFIPAGFISSLSKLV